MHAAQLPCCDSGKTKTPQRIVTDIADQLTTASLTDVYLADREPGYAYPKLLQTIPSIGQTHGLCSFAIGGSFYLALATRQLRQPYISGDLSVYDVPSEVLAWDPATKRYYSHHLLDSSFKSVPERAPPPGLADSFCFPKCMPADDGLTYPVDYLRGATDILVFESTGELYMAVAQSVCDTLSGSTACRDYAAQPQSAVLQWDTSVGRFGEIMSVTQQQSIFLRGAPMTAPELAATRRSALRIDAGRAVSWIYIELDNVPYLICSSLTKGAVVYQFVFTSVAGLGSGIAVGSDGADLNVYSVGLLTDSLVRFSRATSFDHLGSKTRTCPGGKCLVYQSTLLQGDIDASGRTVEGLKGARKVATSSNGCGPNNLLPCVRVSSGVYRDEVPCASPPLLAPASPSGDAPPLMACQARDFTITELPGGTLGLFSAAFPPRIDSRGKLSVTVDSDQTGQATFSVVLRDGAGGFSTERRLQVEVVRVNKPPAFTPANIIVDPSQWAPRQTAVFAEFVTAGLGEDEVQAAGLSFAFQYDNPGLFLDPAPELAVERVGGVLKAVVRFSIDRLQTGSSSFSSIVLSDTGSNDALLGSVAHSSPGAFTFSIKKSNRAPSFVPLKDVVMLENVASISVPGFVTYLTKGGPDEDRLQVVTFSLGAITRVAGTASTTGLITSFALGDDGTLHLSVALQRPGTYTISVKTQDNGGTADGGVDTVYVPFTLRIAPVDFPPSFLVSPGGVVVFEAATLRPQELPGVLRLSDEILSSRGPGGVTFTVMEVTSGAALFAAPPQAFADGVVGGSLLLTLVPQTSGSASLIVRLSMLSRLDPTKTLAPFTLTVPVSVSNVNSPPSFKVWPMHRCLEDGDPQLVPNFAYDLSVGQPEERFIQTAFFNLSVSPPDLFLALPEIDSSGALSYEPAPGRQGQASIKVQMFDDGGTVGGGVNYDIDGPREFAIKIMPRPRVASVTPETGPVEGGYTVTVSGAFFGSRYSRGVSMAAYSNLSVAFGSAPCLGLVFVSDSSLMCTAPPGMGYADVSVTVIDGALTRTGTGYKVFSFALLYYAGVADGGGGFVAQGPDPEAPGELLAPTASASVQTKLPLSRGVAAMAALGGRIYVGGSFERPHNHIMAWDGGDGAVSLGNGLDGAVSAMAVHRGRLVVGGAFVRAMQPRSIGGSINCAGLALWEGDAGGWGLVGRGEVRGLVSSVVSAGGGKLYVGGRISGSASQAEGSISGVAVWNGSSWGSLGGGVDGGEVRVMLVANESVFVGGTFARAGGRAAANVARWDSRVWVGMGDVNGPVVSMAALGESVFVGGYFTVAGGKEVNGIARFHNGKWVALGGGVSGGVLALRAFGRCMYIGGRFATARDTPSGPEKPARGAARWCVDPQELETPVFEAVRGLAGVSLVNAIVAAGTASEAGFGEQICALGEVSMHCNTSVPA